MMTLSGSLDRNECCAPITIKSECDCLKKVEVFSSQLLNNSSGQVLMDDDDHLCE